MIENPAWVRQKQGDFPKTITCSPAKGLWGYRDLKHSCILIFVPVQKLFRQAGLLFQGRVN